MLGLYLMSVLAVVLGLQRDLEAIAESLRIPGNKSLGPVSKV